MRSARQWLGVPFVALVVIALVLPSGLELQAASARRLEIFSWWTAGGEADGLKAMFEIYRKRYPGVEIINATVAGGAGTNAKAVLKTRMTGGDPPDSFQVHGGQELTATWVVTGFMEPLGFLYRGEGWTNAFPKDLVDIVSYRGEPYSVPVNVHRGNVLWFNKKVFDEAGLKAPTTWEEFFRVADALRAKGITPLALGDKNKWEAAHLFEDVLVAALGANGYRGLWDGRTAWAGDGVKRALETFARILGYVNSDHAAGTWDSATQMVIERKAAMTIMGDWTAGYFTSKGWKAGTDYGWAPAPGTAGTFVVVTDTFGLPKKAPHRTEAVNWLRVAGSREGQEAFNPLKGSICARTDCDPNKFDAYLKSSAADFRRNALVPSEVHGSAAPEGFATVFNDVVNLFVTNKDVAAAQRALQKACVDNKMCR